MQDGYPTTFLSKTLALRHQALLVYKNTTRKLQTIDEIFCRCLNTNSVKNKIID